MGFASKFRDSRLVARTLAGDSAAFAALAHRHMPAVAAVALAYTKNHADADDVVQEAFLKAWQSLDALRTPRLFGGWVVTIARNVARARHNQVRRESETLKQFGLETAMHVPHDSNDGEDHLHRLLPGLLAELPESDRELVLLHYYGGKKTREVAELLALSHDAVRKRLERIRHKLGQSLLASLEPGSEDKARRDKRAARIASAVVAFPVPWKHAAAGGIWAVGGASLALKWAVVAVIAVPIIVAAYHVSRSETPISPVIASNATRPALVEAAPREAALPVRPAEKAMDATPAGTTTATIAGQLLEQDTGNGVPGGTINLESVATKEGTKAITDDTGNYAFEALPPGEYWLSLYCDEAFVQRYPRNRYAHQERKIALEAGTKIRKVDFTVIRGLTVRGQVVYPRGNPVPGATVAGWSDPNTVEATITTDAEGHFEFTGFGTDAPAYFWPHHPGLAMPPHGPVTIPPEGMDDLVLAMHAESSMSGRVVDQFGTPLPGAQITFWPRGMYTVPQEFIATTDEKGDFAIGGLYASRYHFDVKRTGETGSQRLEETNDIDLAEGEALRDIELVYEIPGDLSISGRVVDDVDAPQRGILVRTGRGIVNRQGETNAEGFYELRDLSPGVYEVTAESISWTGPQWVKLEAEAGQTDADFVFPRTGTIRGRVVEAATGEPIPAFEVMVPPGVFRWTGFQDIEGRFEIGALLPGERSIYARAEGYAAGSSKPVTLASGATLEDIIVALEKAGSISVRVLGPDGAPVRDAVVGADGAMPSFGEVPRTDGNGTFRIGDARPGLQTIHASHPDYAPGSVQANIRAGELAEAEIRLSKGGTLRGVLSHNGESLQGVRVELNQWIGENEIGYNREVNAAKDGSYTFNGIPAGELVLRVNPTFGAQGRVIESPVRFTESEEKAVNIAVDQGFVDVVFDIEMGDDLIARDGTIWIELAFPTESGGSEQFYTYAPYSAELRLEGVRTGAATLQARYLSPGLSEALAEIEPRDIMVGEGTETRIPIVFTALD